MSQSKSALRNTLLRSWHQPNWLSVLLWPFSVLYRILFALRKCLYSMGIMASYRAPVPVIVIGNLTVGGTGKTPLVIYVVERLRELGFKPGVISRGYNGNASVYPLLVDTNTPVVECGDEPALIVRRTGVPMVVGPDRQADIKLLLEQASVDVIVSDDGLQHLALQRDIEVCLVDATSPLENKLLLPAGPFREPHLRLESIDLVVYHHAEFSSENQSNDAEGHHSMWLAPSEPQSLDELNSTLFDASKPVHAVAGIGNPQRFFNTCRKLGLVFEEHAFADHHRFLESDLDFGDDLAVLMTEKDAVKCHSFVKTQYWYLPVEAKLSSKFSDALAQKLMSTPTTR